MSLPATELSGTAPPLDSPLGHVPEDERAADNCPPRSSPPHSKRYGDATDHFHVLPFYGWADSDGSESQPCTAPPPVETSQQLGMSGVRVAVRQAASSQASTSRSGGLHDRHLPHQTGQTHDECPVQSSLNPEAVNFVMRDTDLIHGGLLRPDLDQDWESVQEAHAGGLGHHGAGIDCSLWGYVRPQGVAQSGQVTGSVSRQVDSCVNLMDGYLGNGLAVPARPLLRASSLKDRIIKLPEVSFIDKILPAPAQKLIPREIYHPDYFQSLHNLVAAAGIRSDGSTYPALTPNYMGARVKLQHVGMNPQKPGNCR